MLPIHAALAGEPPSRPAALLLDALVSDERALVVAEWDCPYDWLVGRWNVRVVDYLVDGAPIRGEGEWFFAWVLDGRAIQDVWISPSRPRRGKLAPGAPNRFGSTLRSYDARRKQWRLVWTNPATGGFDILWARRSGADIVQEGVDADGNPMRWVFTDIAPRSARWYGERSRDGGKSWRLEAEFFLERAP